MTMEPRDVMLTIVLAALVLAGTTASFARNALWKNEIVLE